MMLMPHFLPTILFGVALAGVTAAVGAATTVPLPPSYCPASVSIFSDGFEPVPLPHEPSNGSGGAYPGNVTRTISVPDFGSRSYYLHVPAG
jgi:hypothetical protein